MSREDLKLPTIIVLGQNPDPRLLRLFAFAVANLIVESAKPEPEPEFNLTLEIKKIHEPEVSFYPPKGSAFIPGNNPQPWKRRRK